MVRSTRYASLRVAGAYGSGLGRSPDRGALVWLDGLRGGMEPEWIQQNVLARPERKAWAAPRSSSDLAVAPWRAVRVGSQWSGDRPSAAEIADISARLQRDRRLDVVRALW